MSRTSFNEASVNKLVLEAFGSGFDNYQTKYQSIFNDPFFGLQYHNNGRNV